MFLGLKIFWQYPSRIEVEETRSNDSLVVVEDALTKS